MPDDAKPETASWKRQIGGTVAAFCLGVVMVLGFMQWQKQQLQIQELTGLVAHLQQGGAVLASTEVSQSVPDIVSRNASPEFTDIGGLSSPRKELSGAQQLELLMAETGIIFEPGDLCFFDGTHDAAP